MFLDNLCDYYPLLSPSSVTDQIWVSKIRLAEKKESF